jgi:hypothetical protein
MRETEDLPNVKCTTRRAKNSGIGQKDCFPSQNDYANIFGKYS